MTDKPRPLLDERRMLGRPMSPKDRRDLLERQKVMDEIMQPLQDANPHVDLKAQIAKYWPRVLSGKWR